MAWQDRPYYRDDGAFNMRFGFIPPTRVALYVMIACVAVFVFQSIEGPIGASVNYWGMLSFRDHLALMQPWRLITYQYLHADGWHIFWNLLAVYFFLCPLERLWGWRKALAFYTLGGMCAGLAFGLITLIHPQPGPLIGASGSVFACLGACALLFPEKQILVLVFFIPLRVLAVLAGLLWILLIIGSRDLSSAAHLGGLVFGMLAPKYGVPLLRRLDRRLIQRRIRKHVELEQTEQEQVDRILKKVHDEGMQSLTRWERRTLRRATEHQRQRDVELARLRRAGQ